MRTLGNIFWFIFGGVQGTSMDFFRMYMVYYNYWNSIWKAVF